MIKYILSSMVVLMLALITNTASAEKIAKEDRELAAFNEISLRLHANIHLVQGKTQSVILEAQESALKEIITEVKGRMLVIREDIKSKWTSSKSLGNVNIYITIPDIQALSISGSGDIFAEDKIKSVIIDLAISGSGNIRLAKLEADKVKAVISGSGDIVISSKKTADNFEARISGSGNIKASQFPVMNSSIKIAGSGSFSTHTTDKLIVRIAGSGDVHYKGGPAIDSKIIGSGRIKEMR